MSLAGGKTITSGRGDLAQRMMAFATVAEVWTGGLGASFRPRGFLTASKNCRGGPHRADEADRDPTAFEFQAQRLGEPDQGKLACAVGPVKGDAPFPDDGGNVYDMPASVPPKDRQDGPDPIKGPEKVYLEDRLHIFGCCLLHQGEEARTGVVHENVHPTEGFRDPLHHGLYLVPLCHVGGEAEHLGAELLDLLLQGLKLLLPSDTPPGRAVPPPDGRGTPPAYPFP